MHFVMPKRKRGKQFAGPVRKVGRIAAGVRKVAAARTLQSVRRRALNRNRETKMSNQTSSDGAENGHNSFVVIIAIC